MQTLNISLPDPLKRFVDEQIADGRYNNVSEYLGELVRADQQRKAEDLLESLLLEGLDGEESALTAADWKSIRQEGLAELEKRKPAR